jgi:quinol monooxygenase YgiN
MSVNNRSGRSPTEEVNYMIAVIARMKVSEGKSKRFEAVIGELARRVIAEEKGCLQYQLCRARDGATYVMLERYADQEALRAHGATPHFAEAAPKLMECLASGPEIEVLAVVE